MKGDGMHRKNTVNISEPHSASEVHYQHCSLSVSDIPMVSIQIFFGRFKKIKKERSTIDPTWRGMSLAKIIQHCSETFTFQDKSNQPVNFDNPYRAFWLPLWLLLIITSRMCKADSDQVTRMANKVLTLAKILGRSWESAHYMGLRSWVSSILVVCYFSWLWNPFCSGHQDTTQKCRVDGAQFGGDMQIGGKFVQRKKFKVSCRYFGGHCINNIYERFFFSCWWAM